MSALVEKLEALSAPCRECEEAIYEAIGNCNHKRYECYSVQGDSGQTCLDCGKDLYGADSAPRYTASIDAAMTLVPEGYVWSINTFAEPSRASAYLVRHDNCYVRTNEQFCATPAIALCIAALKATSMETDNG